MTVYADSSFLVSVYLMDKHSPDAAKILERLVEPLPFTVLSRYETRNAIHLAVFRKETDRIKHQAALRQIEMDIEAGRLLPITVDWADIYRQAEILADKHTQKLGTRSLDMLHIAIALTLGTTQFLTFDSRQGRLAKEVGLNVRP